jgi:hypothetical protein
MWEEKGATVNNLIYIGTGLVLLSGIGTLAITMSGVNEPVRFRYRKEFFDERTVFVRQECGGWKVTPFVMIQKNDVFRLYEANGCPVDNGYDGYDFLAVEDAQLEVVLAKPV